MASRLEAAIGCRFYVVAVPLREKSIVVVQSSGYVLAVGLDWVDFGNDGLNTCPLQSNIKNVRDAYVGDNIWSSDLQHDSCCLSGLRDLSKFC
jgi:hypothetical protein